MPLNSDGLTPQQETFTDEFCVDENATQAAIRAKYSEKGASVQGTRLLANDRVRAVIDRKLAAKRALITERMTASVEAVAKKSGLSMERVRQEWEKIGHLNIWPLLVKDANGKPLMEKGWFQIDWSLMTEEIAAAVAEFHPDKGVKFYSKEAVLRDIARHMGGFQKDAPQVTINLTMEQLIIASMDTGGNGATVALPAPQRIEDDE